MLTLGILVSGSGTNLQAIIDCINSGELQAKIAIVVSSRPGVKALERAKSAGIPFKAMAVSDYDNPDVADELLVDIFSKSADVADAARATNSADAVHATNCAAPDYIIMAGYMRKVGTKLLAAFPNRIVNIHPALLPSFKGAHAIKDAFDYGVKITGVTVHLANEEYDEGKILAQVAVPVLPNDTLEALEARIHEVEHKLLPNTISTLPAILPDTASSAA